MNEKEIVTIKGSADGVRLILDTDATVSDILARLREKIKSAKGFFKGECNVYISGKELEKSDRIRLVSVMNTLFPEAKVIFKEDEEPQAEVVHAQNHTQLGAKFMEYLMQTAEQSKGMLKQKTSVKPDKIDVKLYKCNLNDGESIITTGDVLLVGDVMKGASVVTDGSIYIMGSLLGSASCGTDETTTNHIMAVEFNPTDISISGITRYFDEFAQESGPKIAYLIKDLISVEKIL